jgi:uncharacterized membrane protein
MIFSTTKSTTKIQTAARILLGLFLVTTGIGHLTWAKTDFIAQVPEWLPVDTSMVVLLSGIIEIALGLSLIFLLSQRVVIGGVAALFFVLIFPGNIAQYLGHKNAFGLNTETARLGRLFFQPVLVIWALWSTGAWAEWRRRN